MISLRSILVEHISLEFSKDMQLTYSKMHRSAKLPQQKALTALRNKVSVFVRVIKMTKSGHREENCSVFNPI